MQISATDFHVAYKVIGPFALPHHSGSLLRGLLGRALRRTACPRAEGPCPAACERPAECVYARLFDPVVPADIPRRFRFLQPGSEAPPRLVPLLPPVSRLPLFPGEWLRFGVRVLGPLDDEDELRLVAAMEAIADLPVGTDQGRVVFDSVAREGPKNREVSDRAEAKAPPERIRVRVWFDTPAWIERRKMLVDRLTFQDMFRAVHRRATMLTVLHGGRDDEDEGGFFRLDALAAKVEALDSLLRPLKWERLSEERGERHWMRGLIGWARFEGELGELMPGLRMGEVLHVGKSTGFGLGKMRVEVEGG